jgi:uncharacterized membrane protein
MIDLHPPLTGLPLAGMLLLLVAEVVRCFPRLRSSGDIIRNAAVLSCIVSVLGAFLSGYQASSRAGALAVAVEDAMSRHHSLGRLLLINSLLLGTFFLLYQRAIRGRGILMALYYLAFVVQLFGTLWVGYLGGQLVFEHGVNVRTVSERGE